MVSPAPRWRIHLAPRPRNPNSIKLRLLPPRPFAAGLPAMPRTFSRIPTSAIVALVHDVLVVLGLFAIFGRLFGVTVDSLFVTAVLTVIGFSVHDTIVIFDRIRENMSRRIGEPFELVVNNAILQSMARSL